MNLKKLISAIAFVSISAFAQNAVQAPAETKAAAPAKATEQVAPAKEEAKPVEQAAAPAKEEVKPEPKKDEQIVLLEEIRDLLKAQTKGSSKSKKSQK